MVNNKCSKCRFKNDNTGTCSNTASEFAEHDIELIPTHNCTHFFSNDDTENISNQDVDDMSDFMLYDYSYSDDTNVK